METQIVIFLACISVTVITNTLLIWFVYKGCAGFTSKITETVSELKTSSETTTWLRKLESASRQAVAVTEAIKIKIAEFEPPLDRAQQHYLQTLGQVDSKLEKTAGDITRSAQKIRDVVAQSAFSTVAFFTTLSRVLETTERED